MEKRNSIDDLFHDKLSRGKEQLNLGAWANMERLLDGENPYAEEEKKKRRILPLLLLLLIGTGAVTAGYLAQNNYFKSTTQATVIASNTHKNALTETSSNIPSKQNDLNSVKEQDTQDANDLQTSNGQSTASNTTSSHGTQQNLVSSEPQNLNQGRKAKRAKKHQKSIITLQQTPSDLGTQENHDAILASSKPEKISTSKNSALAINKQEQNLSQLNSSKIKQGESFIETKTIPMVEIKQKAEYNKNGTVKKFSSDTISKSTITQQYETILQSQPETLAAIDYHISNPRYVDLNAEAELKANEQSEINAKQEASNSVATVSSNMANSHSLNANTSVVKKRNSSSQTTYFEDLRRFTSDTYQKLVNAVKFGAHPDTYTGLSMGMNASLSSAQNNFGGFHLGVTNLKPISDYASILSEFKFFYRNNGGYTINDIYTRTLNMSTDNISLAHQTIYNYQKDSTVRTYNFKNFYSLELPLMMQFNYRSVALYGGVNMAYNFKLNVNEKTKNYVIDYHDTVPNSYVYTFPADKGSQLQRSDFSSRFGLGYTIGASYQFNPQLYIDVRMTQNVWDNMKTNAAREISNGFFKVPNIQFSLGYRFRKFVPDN